MKTIGSNSKTYSVNKRTCIINGVIPQYFIRDITVAISEYNRTFIMMALDYSALAGIGLIIILILRSGLSHFIAL